MTTTFDTTLVRENGDTEVEIEVVITVAGGYQPREADVGIMDGYCYVDGLEAADAQTGAKIELTTVEEKSLEKEAQNALDEAFSDLKYSQLNEDY
jgi:hypothetical protein